MLRSELLPVRGVAPVERSAGRDAPGIRAAEPSDLPAILALLEAAGLPLDGVEEGIDGFVVAETAAGLMGVAGLERHGRDAVLRSVAVDSRMRGSGLGDRLTRRVLKTARKDGVRRVYLLTTTAADYFPRFGFRRVPREEASPGVRESVEFREACPASAVAMALELA